MATLQEMQAQAMEPAMIGLQSQQPVKRQQTGGTVAPSPIGSASMFPVEGSAYPTTDPSLYGSMQRQAQNYQVPEGYEPMQPMIGLQSQQPVKRQQTGGTVAPSPIGSASMFPVERSAYPTTDASLYGSMQRQAQNYQVPEGYEPMQPMIGLQSQQMASNPAYLDMQRNAQLQMLQQQQQQKMERDRARQLQQQQRATAGAISPLGGAIAGSASPSVMQNALPLLQAMQSRGYAENPRYQRAQRERQLQMQRQMAGIGNYGGGGQIGQDTSNMDMNALLEMLRSMGLIQ